VHSKPFLGGKHVPDQFFSKISPATQFRERPQIRPRHYGLDEARVLPVAENAKRDSPQPLEVAAFAAAAAPVAAAAASAAAGLVGSSCDSSGRSAKILPSSIRAPSV
jgi:hypothetical protein